MLSPNGTMEDESYFNPSLIFTELGAVKQLLGPQDAQRWLMYLDVVLSPSSPHYPKIFVTLDLKVTNRCFETRVSDGGLWSQ